MTKSTTKETPCWYVRSDGIHQGRHVTETQMVRKTEHMVFDEQGKPAVCWSIGKPKDVFDTKAGAHEYWQKDKEQRLKRLRSTMENVLASLAQCEAEIAILEALE